MIAPEGKPQANTPPGLRADDVKRQAHLEDVTDCNFDFAGTRISVVTRIAGENVAFITVA